MMMQIGRFRYAVLLLGIALACLWWFAEAAIHHFLLGEGASLWDCIFPSDANELWMRIFIFMLIVAAGAVLQLFRDRIGRLERQPAITQPGSDIISVCANCRKVRQYDGGRWVSMESYIE